VCFQNKSKSAQNNDCLKLHVKSGFDQTLKNVYNHFLETFLSVLSSMSNEILLELFSEVLYPTIMQIGFETNMGQENWSGVFATDICIYILKITDKIVNICQGDVQLTNEFLTVIFQEITNVGKSGTVHLAVQNLWQTLTHNAFRYYSGKDIKNVCLWIFERLNMVKERAEDLEEQDLTQLKVLFDLISQLTKRESPQKEEIEDEDDPYLGIKRHYNHDYSLIKRQTKNQMDLDLYNLVPPVLFWCDYAVEKESRIQIFKPAWKSLVHLLESLPVDTNK
jgi:hypothetical protein